jgi:hypothetical protein
MGTKAYAAVLIALVANPAGAETRKKVDRSSDLPGVLDARHVSENNWLSVRCLQVAQSQPRQADCEFNSVRVSDPQTPTKEIELWKGIASAGKWTAQLEGGCKSNFRAVRKSPEQIELRRKILESCKNRSASGYATAMIDELVKEAQMCRVSQGLAFTWRFTQVNADTWTYTTNVAAIDQEVQKLLSKAGGALGMPDCHATVTATLWRNTGDDSGSYFWNYSQVRAVPPNDPAECAALTKSNEWLFFDHDRIPLTCRYLGP